MSEQLNYMPGQFCSCSDILSEHLLLLIENPAIKTHHYGSEAELMRLQEVIKCEVSTPTCTVYVNKTFGVKHFYLIQLLLQRWTFKKCCPLTDCTVLKTKAILNKPLLIPLGEI